MTQKATVSAILADGRAEIYLVRSGACGENCVSCKGCGEMKNSIRANALNKPGAKPGDIVTVETRSSYILGLGFLLFLLPLVLFAAGYLIGSPFSERLAPLTGFAGLAAGFILLIPANRYAKKKNEQLFEITSIIFRAEESPQREQL